MLLYQDPRAPNPRRVRIFCAEKGMALDTVDILIANNDHQAPSFRAKNPLALLPVLELADGKVLRESIAICRYLEELHPTPALFGTTAWERAIVEQWNRHAELEFMFPISQIFRNTHPFWEGRIEQVPAFADVMRTHVASRLAWMDGELGKRPFVAGEQFSVADITLLCALDFAKVSKLRIDPATTPNVAAWHARVSSRPSAGA